MIGMAGVRAELMTREARKWNKNLKRKWGRDEGKAWFRQQMIRGASLFATTGRFFQEQSLIEQFSSNFQSGTLFIAEGVN